MPPASRKKKASLVSKVSKEDHFKDLSRGLGFLRKNQSFTDLRFLCGKSKQILAHKAIFAPHSPLLGQLFEITEKRQPGHPVFISCPETEAKIVEKLVEYLYLGQTTIFGEKTKNDLKNFCLLLGMKKLNIEAAIQIQDSDSDSNSDSHSLSSNNCVKKTKTTKINKQQKQQTKRFTKESETDDSENDNKTEEKKNPPKKKRENTPPSKTKKKENENNESKEINDVEEAKEKAKRSKSEVKLQRCEDDESREVKKFLKIATKENGNEENGTYKKMTTPSLLGAKANPLFAGKGTRDKGKMKATPQKRRMTEQFDGDKKIEEIKDSKKMRQDSTSSSSDVDQELIEKRKKEALVDTTIKNKEDKEKQKKKSANLDSDSDSASSSSGADFAKKPAKQIKNEEKETTKEERKGKPKIGPKSKKKIGPASATGKDKENKNNKEKDEIKKEKMKDMFTDEQIQCCNICQAIFISKESLERHMTDKHDGDSDKEEQSHSLIKSEISASSEGEKEKDEEMERTKKKVLIKKKKRSSTEHNKNKDEDSDDEARKSEKKKTPKIGFKASQSEYFKQSKKSGSVASSGSSAGGFRQCIFCPETFEKGSNLKNHVLNHFKEKLMQNLEAKKPFPCPDCAAVHRDKITLLRHYSFTHKHIFKYCNESDLAGKPADSGNIGNSTSSKKKPKEKEPVTTPRGPGKKSKEFVLSSDSDSSGDEMKKKKKKAKIKNEEDESEDNENKEKKADKPEEKTEEKTETKSVVSSVKFSDTDSDDDSWKKPKEAVQSCFDDLLGSSEVSKDPKNESDKKKADPPIFNKDSDSESELAKNTNGTN